MELDRDPGTLWSWITGLGEIGGHGDGGVTRMAWTPELRAGNAWLRERYEELGLSVAEDAAGNLFGTWEAGEGPPVLVGSHIDTVPRGGRFDGALGVHCGLEAVRLLQQAGHAPRRPLRIVGWMDEEGARFKTPTFGSRAFAGHDLSGLSGQTDDEGVTLPEAMAGWGRDFERLPEARGVDGIGAYLELHIEQGPTLEERAIDIGVVTTIVAVLGLRVRFEGVANHAGTTPMDRRRDALVAAADGIGRLQEWIATQSYDTRLTVGIIEAEPGGFNVIPSACEFTIDARAVSETAVAAVEREVRGVLASVGEAHGTPCTVRRTHLIDAVPVDPAIADAIEAAAAADGATAVRMPSGGGHDASHVGPHVPMGMLFVPSRAGISHNPLEHTEPGQCHAGARVLARALATLTG
jgi:allantoate deiminase